MGQGRIVRGEGSDPFKASGRDNDGRLDFFVFDVGWGFSPPLHTHASQEDSFYVVQGVLMMQLDDDVLEIGPGDFATAAPGVAHSFTITSPERPARLVNLMTPGIGFDQYIREVGAPGGASPEQFEQLNRDYGVEIVGPSLAARLGYS